MRLYDFVFKEVVDLRPGTHLCNFIGDSLFLSLCVAKKWSASVAHRLYIARLCNNRKLVRQHFDPYGAIYAQEGWKLTAALLQKYPFLERNTSRATAWPKEILLGSLPKSPQTHYIIKLSRNYHWEL